VPRRGEEAGGASESMLASNGLKGPPCGTPLSVSSKHPLRRITPALRYLRMSFRTLGSAMLSRNFPMSF
jgi:hypothetical protein